jgi:hypothetical protein
VTGSDRGHRAGNGQTARWNCPKRHRPFVIAGRVAYAKSTRGCVFGRAFLMCKFIARYLLATITVFVGWANATAATIDTRTLTMNDGEPLSIISIDGELAADDLQKFINEAIRASHAVVVFNSPGGSTAAGMEIGKAIHLKGFATLVLEGSTCASACGLAWLGGTPRMMSAGARVGFHASYVNESGHPEVSSVGNAVVGGYLSQLGLSSPAIAYLSEAQPSDMQWLTFADASRIGLEVRAFELPSQPPPEPSAAVRRDQGPRTDWGRQGKWIQLYSRMNYSDALTLAKGLVDKFSNTSVFAYDNGWYVVVIGPYGDDVARRLKDIYLSAKTIPDDAFLTSGTRFVDRIWPLSKPDPAQSNSEATALTAARAFFAESSAPQEATLTYLDQVYANQVVYFGKLLPKSDVIADKRQFVERWPVRSYSARPGSLSAACRPGIGCTVTGIIDFKAYSPARGEESDGVARFELTFDGNRLVSESSTVVSRERHKAGTAR